jgi:hypothetical protein
LLGPESGKAPQHLGRDSAIGLSLERAASRHRALKEARQIS